jgi:hypothetical protein
LASRAKTFNRLIDGKSIRVSLADMGVMINGDVTIFFGETEQPLTQQMAPFIGPDTNVTIDPRIKSKMT